MTPAAGRGRPLLVAWCALLSVVLIAPTLVVVPMGFTSAQTFAFPPPGWSTRWYKSFFSNPQWYDAALLSLKVALIVVVLATVLGTAASLAVARGRGRWTGALRSLFLAPMIVPGVITAIGIYIVFLKWHLTETVLGFVLAHTMMALPLVIITVGASLQSLDRSLERAAASLGANPWRTFTGVTLPLIMPGMLTGALFAFLTSFDEAIISLFLSGPSNRTLPVQMYMSVTAEIDPTIAAASTMVIVTSTSLLLIAGIFASHRRTRRV